MELMRRPADPVSQLPTPPDGNISTIRFHLADDGSYALVDGRQNLCPVVADSSPSSRTAIGFNPTNLK